MTKELSASNSLSSMMSNNILIFALAFFVINIGYDVLRELVGLDYQQYDTDNIRFWKLPIFPACLSSEAVRYVQTPDVSMSTLTRTRRRTKMPSPQPVAARVRAKIPSITHRFLPLRLVQLGLLHYQRQRMQVWAADSEITSP